MDILKVFPQVNGHVFRGKLRRKMMYLSSIILLALHLWWHTGRDIVLDCHKKVKQADSTEECRYIKPDFSLDRPMVGCTTTGRVIYKDAVRVMGTGLKRKVFLTIGLPTVQRVYKNVTASYLENTLDYLMEGLTLADMKQVHIVIFLADFEKQARDNVKKQIVRKYQQLIDSNFINVIEAPRKFYPKLKGLIRTFGDSQERMFWRSKQSLDYAFLFNYCEGLSEYYLQIEDDVKTSRKFFSTIKSCIQKNGKSNFTFINTCTWGFIGKLFKNEELDYFSRVLQIFYKDIPCDWLLHHYVAWRGDGSSFFDRLCENIFDHIGNQSSSLGT